MVHNDMDGDNMVEKMMMVKNKRWSSKNRERERDESLLNMSGQDICIVEGNGQEKLELDIILKSKQETIFKTMCHI